MTALWDIRRQGRSWDSIEFRSRADLRPEKLEIMEGKLLLDDEERLNLLGLLLENVGADQVVRMGAPAVWIAAVAAVHKLALPSRPFLADSFNRWMLLLWCLNLAVVVLLVSLPPHLLSAPPATSSLILCAVVAYVTSLGVHVFLKP